MVRGPNRKKIYADVNIGHGRHALIAESKGLDGSFEVPGGGGKNVCIFVEDTREFIFKQIEQRNKDIRNLENKLARVREAIRARNIGSISLEEGTNSKG